MKTYIPNIPPRQAATRVFCMLRVDGTSMVFAGLLVACALILYPPLIAPGAYCAYAAVWPVGTSQLSPSLSFHAAYQYEGGACVHSGIDIPSSAGASVVSPVSGTAIFVGDVPSGDAISASTDSQTMQAVSIGLADGRRVTLMPFASVSVAQGERVGEGEALGTLAASGDRSSSATHLHMGLKRGGFYQDPMSLFGAVSRPDAQAKPKALSIAGVAAAPVEANASAQAQGTQENRGGEGAASLQPEEVVSVSPVPDEEPAAEAEQFGFISSGSPAAYRQAEPGFDIARQAKAFFSPLVQACSLQFQDLILLMEDCASAVGLPFVLVSLVAVLLAALVLGLGAYGIVKACRKIFRRARVFAKSSLVASGGECYHSQAYSCFGSVNLHVPKPFSPEEVTK